jgi:2,2-dialkylglycine decarboxylase (pyruvate)
LMPSPYALRCPFSCGQCDMRCFDQALELVDRATSGAPAAVILEPVIGAGGIVPLPRDWIQAVRTFCDDRGALLIADEALTGLGRTGRWFAFEHTGIVPDLVVTSKALGGGVPAAAVITSRAIAEEALDRGFVNAASHQGDPMQCAVALANIEVMEREGLVDNARRMGELLGERLQGLVSKHPIAVESRGIGLIQGIEIADHGAESPELAAEVSLECLGRGLIVGGLRPGIREGNTLRLAPPLVVTEGEISEAVAVLDSALAVTTSRRRQAM